MTAKTSYAAQRAKADDIPMQKAALKDAQDRFRRLSSKFALNMDTGQTLNTIADCCKRNGVELNSVQPGNPVEKVYQGHLMAVPVKLEVTGAFPNVIKAMNDIENASNPAELREVKISAAKEGVSGDVTADLTVVFYSLSKPEITQYVTAPSGNYNPFFALKQPPQNIQPAQGSVQQSQPGAGQQLPLVNQVLPDSNTQAQPVPRQTATQPPGSGQTVAQTSASGQQTTKE
nr:type 4a pilus biogenesis protein PilO [Desulfofundulus thermobenzoicus]